MALRFDEFLKEREYLLGVSPATLTYYRSAFTTWTKFATDDSVLAWVQGMKAAGLSNASVNTHICAMRAYFKWAEPERPRIAYLKEEQKILATFSADSVRAVINWKAVKGHEPRLKALALTALDTGMRIEELLRLHRCDLNFDALVIRVKGKGNRERLVPMSIELRKVLYRHLRQHKFERVFCTEHGVKLCQRNVLRDFKAACRKLNITGVRCSFHTLRHSFAVNYLRAGGNLYYLQRILGHSSITTTERYLKSLGVEDLQRVHDGLSLLSR